MTDDDRAALAGGRVMDRAAALDALRSMLVLAQKARSDMREGVGDDAVGEAILTDLHPWLFGPKSILPTLSKVVARAERGEPIAGSDLYNLMWVAKSDPTFAVGATALGYTDLPEPQLGWFGQTW